MAKRNDTKFIARGGMTKPEVVAAVFARDGNQCTRCGIDNEVHRTATGKGLQLHRLTPGGNARFGGRTQRYSAHDVSHPR